MGDYSTALSVVYVEAHVNQVFCKHHRGPFPMQHEVEIVLNGFSLSSVVCVQSCKQRPGSFPYCLMG